MKIKSLLSALGVAACASMIPLSASAQYPERPIKLIIPYAPGGTVDTFARVIGPALGARLGQPIVIDNIQGAGQVPIGIARLANAAPDGYTIGLGIVSDVVLAPLTDNTAAYTYRDLEAIAPLGTSGAGVVSKPSLGFKSLSDMIAYAKANPGKLSYGATGAGSLPALAMDALKRQARIDMAYVPYQSASKIALDVMGGHLDIAVSGLPALLEHIKSGKVSGIGVLSEEHDPGAPELPAAGDTPELKGINCIFWTGVFAPKGTPAAIVNRVNAAFADVMRDEKVRARFRDFGVKISEPMSPANYAKFVAASHAQWEALRPRPTKVGAFSRNRDEQRRLSRNSDEPHWKGSEGGRACGHHRAPNGAEHEPAAEREQAAETEPVTEHEPEHEPVTEHRGGETEPVAPAEPETQTEPVAPSRTRHRPTAAAHRAAARPSREQVVVGVLLAVVGFAAVARCGPRRSTTPTPGCVSRT